MGRHRHGNHRDRRGRNRLAADFGLAWLITWIVEAAIAIAIAGWTMVSKAREAGTSLFTGPGRRFVYSFAPPFLPGRC